MDILDPWFDLYPDDPDCYYIYGPNETMSDWCYYGGYRNFMQLRDRNLNMKALLSIGGWNAGSGDYSVMADDRSKRDLFIDSCLLIASDYDFDGIDLDWEYPGTRQGANCSGNCYDIDNFSVLIEEMYTALKPQGLIFTSAVAAGYDKIAAGYHITDLNSYFDFVHIMGYDFAGAWNK